MAARVIVQARTRSSRLPAKALLPVADLPILVLVAARAANTGLPVVVATSTESDDDLLAQLAQAHGFPVVRGSLVDPLARFVQASSDLLPTDVVVRITADNTVPDGELLEALIARVTPETPYARLGGADRSLPYGLSAEAFTVAALRQADAAATRAEEREHVTVWMREHLAESVLTAQDIGASWPPLRCTVDTIDDYLRIARVFSHFERPIAASWRALLDALQHMSTSYEQLTVASDSVTALRQSRLIIGTAQLGSAYGATNAIGDLDEQQANALLHSVMQHGISHVDTARAYGKSESRIGQALQYAPAEPFRVVTKVMPLDSPLPAAATPHCYATAVRASVFESLTELRVSSVDALLVHRAADWFREGVREELLTLRDAGYARVLGASIAAPSSLAPLLADEEIQYIQLPFHLLDRRWTSPEVTELLQSRPDVTVTVRSVFLQGLLTGNAAKTWPRNLGITAQELHASLNSLAQKLGRQSARELAIAYVLGHAWVDSVVIGVETPEQLSELVTLCNRPPLSADEIATVMRELPALGAAGLDPSRWEFV